MSRTPEVIIVTWRKFLHDLFAGVAGVTGIVAVVAFLSGSQFILSLIMCLASAYIASKIKFKLVKRFEVGEFEWA